MQVEKWSRYKKSILSVCLGLMAMAISVCSFSMISKASVIDEYYLDYAEPACGSTQGYISLAVRKNSTGVIDIHTFFWSSHAYDNGQEIPCDMFCDMDIGAIRFRPYVDTDYADDALILLTHIDQNGVYIPYSPRDISTGAPSWSWQNNGYTLLGFKYGGNVLADFEIPQSYKFALYFSDDGSAQQLMYIYSLISSSQYLQQEQLNKLTSIINSNNSIDDKLGYIKEFARSIHNNLIDVKNQLAELIEEEKKQTSWLEKIWQALTGSDEQKDKIEEESSKAQQQASQLEDLNEQNQTEKVDPSQAQNSVNSAIDRNQIQNYSIVLSVFTNESHISQMLLIVIALTLVSYVLFGKK